VGLRLLESLGVYSLALIVSVPATKVRLMPCQQLLLTLWVGRVTIDILPDDVLLLIFHFDRLTHLDGLEDISRRRPSWKWHRFVHVCRRWRSLVFASPNFLELRLVCGPRTRVELTGIWPPLPIVIRNIEDWSMPEDYNFNAVIAYRDRVCEISLLHLTSPQFRQLASAMQKQFPALIHLVLGLVDYYKRPAPALPNGFLAGSAPLLQTLELHHIPFPALPKILLSATHLVRLTLRNIFRNNYFLPEAIVTSLAVLANLKYLTIEFNFKSLLSRPDWERRRPPPARTVLPALTRFEFSGVSEYLEDLVARIDAPLLDSLFLTLSYQLAFGISQLAQFMRRTARFRALDEAHVNLDFFGVQVESFRPTRTFDEKSRLRITCEDLNWQFSSLVQVFRSFFPSIYTVEHLYIYGSRYVLSQWQGHIRNRQWLEIFHPFTAVKNLYVIEEFAKCIAPSLQELDGGRVVDVLPALESLFLEDLRPRRRWRHARDSFGQFVAARQLLGHPVAVSHWNVT
jgi:hypothetical protein